MVGYDEAAQSLLGKKRTLGGLRGDQCVLCFQTSETKNKLRARKLRGVKRRGVGRGGGRRVVMMANIYRVLIMCHADIIQDTYTCIYVSIYLSIYALQSSTCGKYYYFAHFKNEAMEIQKYLSNLLKAKQLKNKDQGRNSEPDSLIPESTLLNTSKKSTQKQNVNSIHSEGQPGFIGPPRPRWGCL